MLRAAPPGRPFAKTYGGLMGYRRRAEARTVQRMSQCLRSLVLGRGLINAQP
jgi:hypothetical protein